MTEPSTDRDPIGPAGRGSEPTEAPLDPPPAGTTALDRLIAAVSVAPIGDDRFRGPGSTVDGVDATFGGHFLSQAISAVLATVEPGWSPHSVHAHFIRAGRPETPFLLDVERIRDGRTFALRRVRTHHPADDGPATDRPDGRLLFELTASCTRTPNAIGTGPGHAPGGDPRHQQLAPPDDIGDLPRPESLPTYAQLMRSLDPLPLPTEWALRDYGIDVRTVNAPWVPEGLSPAGGIRLWIRADGPLPDDPGLHAALLAYQSDESLADNVAAPWGATWGGDGVVFVSLDHAMWFHRPIDLGDWHLLDQRPVVVESGRGLATASVWTAEGELVASITQEAMFRLDEDFEPYPAPG